MSNALLQPEAQVLSTLNANGSRRWLKPRLAKGRFLAARRAVAWLLIAVFCTLPHLRIDARPAVLLDLVRREFTIFGKVFLPTDTLLLMLLMMSVFVTVFLMTALFGRVWCGWACPQTVYMEFVFRPLERLLDGAPGRAAPKRSVGARRALKYALFVIVSAFLAHTFLSYFVGTDALRHWVFESPASHPAEFGVVIFVTLLMLFNFSFFREQTCILACPYGRMQSVMLDRESLIVTYDAARGEPRGHAKRGGATDIALPIMSTPGAAAGSMARGDCVDCGLCVSVCPTGIDIRLGLQMECIGCAQCIDACDDVMTKIKRPTGLIRYSSQNALAGVVRRIRPRVVVYPLVLCLLLGGLAWRLQTAAPMDVTLLRQRGLPFNTLPAGEIANQLQIKVANRTRNAGVYTVSLDEADAASGLRLVMTENPLSVPAGETRVEPFLIAAPASAFDNGRRDIGVIVRDMGSSVSRQMFRLLGPAGATREEGGKP